MKLLALSQGLFSLVDDEDYERVAAYNWSVTSSKRVNYAHRRNGNSFIRLHRFILGDCGGLAIDHIDGDGLNNQKHNLRACSAAENSRNIRKRRTPSLSEYKGVTIDARSASKFRARIRFNYRLISIGSFSNEVDAAWAYDRAARNLFGAFARCNFAPPPMVIPRLAPSVMEGAA